MTRSLFLRPLLLLALLGACDDTSGPEPVRDVDILLGTSPAGDPSIRVGETVQLRATTKDGSGQALTGRAVTWRSTLPAVAGVDSTGLVTGHSVGTALIIATSEAAADTARVTVTAPAPGTPTCAAGDAGTTLQVGEVRTYTAAQLGTLCLRDGGAGSEYVYIPFNSTATAGNLAVEVLGGGIVAAQGPPNPASIPLDRAGGTEPHEDWVFHRWLRDEERRMLATPAARGAGVLRSIAAAVPDVGDRLRLSGDPDAPCTAPDYRTATVEAVSDRAIVVVDSFAALASDEPFSRADFEGLASLFDELIWPTVTTAMGTPSDIDGNERVILFFTTAVNQLTDPGSGSYTGGFFHPRDLNPNTGQGACLSSNFGEVLYMLVPDSAFVRQNLNPFRRVEALDDSPGVIGHELQHVINTSGRRRRGVSGEEVWMNEGLSHIAEELLFYAASGLDSEQNLTVEAIRATEQIRAAFNQYQASNFGRFQRYLQSPQDQSLIGIQQDDDLPTRGASWAFLRYAADREADGEAAKRTLWFDLVNSNSAGLTNLERVFGEDALQWMQDWTTSVYTDDAGIGAPARYQQPSWHFRNIYAALSSSGRYSLRTFALSEGGEGVTLAQLQGGGAAFIRFGIAANGQAAIRATSGGLVPPERLRISVVRTR